MKTRSFRFAFFAASIALTAFAILPRAHSADVPPFKAAAGVAPESGSQTAVFAGGCFWGVDAVFKHVKGVTRVISGYAGGAASTAEYETVSTGTTGHAESVQVTYDPTKISYPQLLQVFFAVAHDPTQVNRQGPDSGTQYRSAIFYANDYQKQVAENYVAQLDGSKSFGSRIATQIAPLKKFYAAESYHQDYLARNPYNPYIIINDLPKIGQLRSHFPDLYR